MFLCLQLIVNGSMYRWCFHLEQLHCPLQSLVSPWTKLDEDGVRQQTRASHFVHRHRRSSGIDVINCFGTRV